MSAPSASPHQLQQHQHQQQQQQRYNDDELLIPATPTMRFARYYREKLSTPSPINTSIIGISPAASGRSPLSPLHNTTPRSSFNNNSQQQQQQQQQEDTIVEEKKGSDRSLERFTPEHQLPKHQQQQRIVPLEDHQQSSNTSIIASFTQHFSCSSSSSRFTSYREKIFSPEPWIVNKDNDDEEDSHLIMTIGRSSTSTINTATETGMRDESNSRIQPMTLLNYNDEEGGLNNSNINDSSSVCSGIIINDDSEQEERVFRGRRREENNNAQDVHNFHTPDNNNNNVRMDSLEISPSPLKHNIHLDNTNNNKVSLCSSTASSSDSTIDDDYHNSDDNNSNTMEAKLHAYMARSTIGQRPQHQDHNNDNGDSDDTRPVLSIGASLSSLEDYSPTSAGGLLFGETLVSPAADGIIRKTNNNNSTSVAATTPPPALSATITADNDRHDRFTILVETVTEDEGSDDSIEEVVEYCNNNDNSNNNKTTNFINGNNHNDNVNSNINTRNFSDNNDDSNINNNNSADNWLAQVAAQVSNKKDESPSDRNWFDDVFAAPITTADHSANPAAPVINATTTTAAPDLETTSAAHGQQQQGKGLSNKDDNNNTSGDSNDDIIVVDDNGDIHVVGSEVNGVDSEDDRECILIPISNTNSSWFSMDEYDDDNHNNKDDVILVLDDSLLVDAKENEDDKYEDFQECNEIPLPNANSGLDEEHDDNDSKLDDADVEDNDGNVVTSDENGDDIHQDGDVIPNTTSSMYCEDDNLGDHDDDHDNIDVMDDDDDDVQVGSADENDNDTEDDSKCFVIPINNNNRYSVISCMSDSDHVESGGISGGTTGTMMSPISDLYSNKPPQRNSQFSLGNNNNDNNNDGSSSNITEGSIANSWQNQQKNQQDILLIEERTSSCNSLSWDFRNNMNNLSTSSTSLTGVDIRKQQQLRMWHSQQELKESQQEQQQRQNNHHPIPEQYQKPPVRFKQPEEDGACTIQYKTEMDNFCDLEKQAPPSDMIQKKEMKPSNEFKQKRKRCIAGHVIILLGLLIFSLVMTFSMTSSNNNNNSWSFSNGMDDVDSGATSIENIGDEVSSNAPTVVNTAEVTANSNVATSLPSPLSTITTATEITMTPTSSPISSSNVATTMTSTSPISSSYVTTTSPTAASPVESSPVNSRLNSTIEILSFATASTSQPTSNSSSIDIEDDAGSDNEDNFPASSWQWATLAPATTVTPSATTTATQLPYFPSTTIGITNTTMPPTTSTTTTTTTTTAAAAPTTMSTTAPLSLHELLVDFSFDNGQALETADSPQSRAFDWLSSLTNSSNIHADGDTILDEYELIQRYALATFYFATNGESWGENNALLISDENGCSWKLTTETMNIGASTSGHTFGVVGSPICDNNDGGNVLGNITSIEFSYNEVQGSIPPEIALLSSHLSAITIVADDNFGSGSNIRVLGGTIPTELFLLTEMKSFTFAGGYVNGNIPTEIGLWNSTLQSLDLHQNVLSGSIPEEIFSFTNLETLLLGDNLLYGTLPGFRNLSNLRTLDVAQNFLYGSIPFHDFNPNIDNDNNYAIKLQSLSLELNDFTSTIATEIGLLSSLQWLSLNDNELSGTIPFEIATFTRRNELRTINLSNNRLNGTIPVSFGYLTQLNVMRLSNNQLSGEIPTQLGLLATNLYAVDLSHNSLNGTIPSSVGTMYELQILDLHENFLHGSLPVDFIDLKYLSSLRIDSNNFTGMAVEPICENNSSSLSEFYSDCIREVVCDCCTYCCLDNFGCLPVF